MDPFSIAAIGANVLGSVGSYFGQKETNKANLKIAREQMDFQERMSSSAYQRAMKDMEKAGLNPILAGKVGGASTPAGASATMVNPVSQSAQILSSTAAQIANVEKTIAETQAIKQNTAIKKPASQIAGQTSSFLSALERNIDIIKSPEVQRQMRRDLDSIKNYLSENYNSAKDTATSYADGLLKSLKEKVDQIVGKEGNTDKKKPLKITITEGRKVKNWRDHP